MNNYSKLSECFERYQLNAHNGANSTSKKWKLFWIFEKCVLIVEIKGATCASSISCTRYSFHLVSHFFPLSTVWPQLLFAPITKRNQMKRILFWCECVACPTANFSLRLLTENSFSHTNESNNQPEEFFETSKTTKRFSEFCEHN